MLENLASLLGGSELFRWKGRQPTILKENEWSEYSEYIMEVGYLKKMTNNKMKCEKWGQTFAFIESNSWGNFAGKRGKKKEIFHIWERNQIQKVGIKEDMVNHF